MTGLRPSRPRLEPLASDAFDPETRSILGDQPLNIFATLARHPKLLKRWFVFGNHVLAKSSLPDRARELVILRTGWRCRAEYEFGQHTVIGRRTGLTDDEIAALCRPLADHAWSHEDRTLLHAVDELHDDQCITDETWSVLRTRWDEHQLLDLVFTVGQYTMVSMALNTLGVQLEDGASGWPT